jgi:hypothetical protein
MCCFSLQLPPQLIAYKKPWSHITPLVDRQSEHSFKKVQEFARGYEIGIVEQETLMKKFKQHKLAMLMQLERNIIDTIVCVCVYEEYYSQDMNLFNVIRHCMEFKSKVICIMSL